MKNEKIIKKVRKFVKEEFRKPSSKYGYEPYEFHLIPMVKLAKKLGNSLGADLEIVELAAWLHDVGSAIYGRENHHLTSAEIAGNKLNELGYDFDKIKKIKECILFHRGSNGLSPKTIEAKVIVEADAMSNFDNLPGIFKAAFIYENQTQGQAKESTRKKLINKYNQLSPEGKKLIKLKYEASMLLLK